MKAATRWNLEQRFALLEERVFKIELRLGPETAPAAYTAASAPQAPSYSPPHHDEAKAPLEPAEPAILEAFKALPPPLPISVAPILPYSVLMSAPASAPAPMPAPMPVRAMRIAYATPQPLQPHVQGAMERAIGLKWAGWIGAVLVVAGAAFGVKFAFDQRWFAQVPPAVWLSGIFLAGAGLIGIGEIIYRRVHVIPAASVFGAGLATLFLAGYVGNAYYELYSPGTALFLMAAAALVGALVAMRGNLVSIAVLSHIGANVAPLLVGSQNAPLESFLIYLLALQMVSLSLASWGRGKKWWTLRGLSLITASLWIVATGLRPGEESLVLIFSLVYAALYHGELIHSAIRRRDETPPAPAGEVGGGIGGGMGGRVGGPDSATFSLLVTACLTLVVLWATRLDAPSMRGTVLVAMATVFALLGWALLRITADANAAIRKISVAHRAAAAGLLVLAVPAAFSGLRADVGWAVLAVAFAVTGAVTQSKIARIGSIVIWLIAAVHLAIAPFLLPEFGGHHAAVWFTIASTRITRDAVLAFGLSVVGQVVAALFIARKPGKPEETAAAPDARTWRTGMELSALATTVWVIGSVVSLPPLAATAWIVEYAWLLVAFEAVVPELQFGLQAAALILLATVKWAMVDTLADRLSPGWSPNLYSPILNPLMGIGALLSASIVTLWSIRGRAIWRALRKQDDVPAGSFVVVMGVVVTLMTLGLSFEIDRVIESAALLGRAMSWPMAQEKMLAWTILWTVSTMVSMGIITAIEPAGLQRLRWFKRLGIIPVLLAVKFVLLDTAPLWGATTSVSLLLNLQMLAALLIAGCLLLASWLSGQNDSAELTMRRMRAGAMLLASGVLMWAVTLEVDRLVEQMAAAGTLHWPLWQAKQLAWTITWSIAAAGTFAFLRWRDPAAHATDSWPRLLPGFLILMAIKFLTIDTVLWRILGAPANVTVLANLETSAGAIVFAALVMALLLRLPAATPQEETKPLRTLFSFASLILLWTGSIEIDRYYAAVPAFIGAARPEQVSLSVFWALFAIAGVLLGFRLRAAPLRYFGLGLLAVTLIKVVAIDMSQVQTGYRILSFMALGAVLLGTSVLYGKFGPRLLGEEEEDEESQVSVG